MAEYAFIVPPHLGHINPTLGVGAELIARGHGVTWVGFTDMRQDVFPRGGVYCYPPEFSDQQEAVQHVLSRQDEAAGNTANKMIRWAFESTWLPFCDITMKGLPDVLARLKPDVIFHDEGLTGAAMCAWKMTIPYATSISSAPGLYYPEAGVLLPDDAVWLKETMSAVKAEYGVDAEEEILNSPDVNIVYTADTLVNGAAFPERYRFIGPAIDGRPPAGTMDWSTIDTSRKTVYISTGSLLKEVKKPFYTKVIEALGEKDLTVLVAAEPDLFDTWPDNFVPRPYWPQLALLPRVDAVVTPGGFNTVNESLYFGRPLLVIPMANDQFGNAILVENSGCGIRLRFRRLTAAKIADSVEHLLNDDTLRGNAEAMARKLKAAGGAARGAALLESLLPDSTVRAAGGINAL